MGAALYCFVIGGVTTLLSFGFAVATVVSNPRKVVVWVLALALVLLSLAPFRLPSGSHVG